MHFFCFYPIKYFSCCYVHINSGVITYKPLQKTEILFVMQFPRTTKYWHLFYISNYSSVVLREINFCKPIIYCYVKQFVRYCWLLKQQFKVKLYLDGVVLSCISRCVYKNNYTGVWSIELHWQSGSFSQKLQFSLYCSFVAPISLSTLLIRKFHFLTTLQFPKYKPHSLLHSKCKQI